jgi:D-alanyl-D-alanine carboxypeptidase
MLRLLPLLLLPAFAAGQALPSSLDLPAIDKSLAGQVKQRGFVGLNVAIMRDGKIVFAKAYGQRDLAGKQPVLPESAFAVGSITKQFTCACILLLQEDGKLKVDDTVAQYYPHLTRAKDITLRDLMNHTSGYPDYYPLDFLDRRMLKPTTLDELAKNYAAGKLDFEPGSRFSYSNTGYNILGGIVEKVSGQPFGSFLKERILNPLKLDNTNYLTPANAATAAKGYTAFALASPEPAAPEAAGWIDAAGALWSTPSDLLNWDLALSTGKVLKPESYKQMTSPRVLTTGKISDYGFGLGVGTVNGEPVIRHTGGVSGFVSGNAFLPRAKSGVVVLSNTEHVSPTSLRAELFNLILKDIEAAEAPAIPKIAGPKPSAAVLEFVKQLVEGKVDRAQLGEEFSIYLTDEKVKASGAKFLSLGTSVVAEVTDTHERGGMEVASVKLKFKSATVRASLYRTPDGKIQQLLFYAD